MALKEKPIYLKICPLILKDGNLRRPVQTSPALQLWVSGEKCFGEDEDAAKTRLVGQRGIFQKTASLDGKSREACGVNG